MKYVPTTTQAGDVNGLRNWTVSELHRLASTLTNDDAATAGDLEAEIAAREAGDAALAAQIEDLYVSTDGSNRTYAQTSAPSSPNIGDLWFDTDNNNTVARWSGTTWAAVDDARIAANAAAIAAEISARQAADTTLTASVNSLASRATSLETVVNSSTDGNLALKARISTEETARASGDTALASRATALEATVNNATTGVAATAARLTTEETARATADSALASRATALEATVNSATDGNTALKARIASEESARATGDTAIASSVSSLTATVNNNYSVLDAAITNEQSARATADSALSSRASSLEATVNSATDGNLALKARIASEETARATGDNALATRATALEATVNSGTTGNVALQARIASEESARASGDSANASQISTVAATASSKNRTFAQAVTPTALAVGDLWVNASDGNKLYRWDGSSWAAVDDTRIAANAAAITTETNARVSGDSALASQINTVSTTVNGNTASITTLQSSVNGLQARYGVSLNVNGYVTGFVQNNNGTSGDFTILADKFSVVAPSGGSPVTPFTVTASGVQINGSLVVNGTITTTALASGAVTAATVYSEPAALTASTSWQTVATVSISAVAGSVAKVDFAARLTGVADTTSIPANYRIKRGSTVIKTGVLTMFQSKQVYTDYVSSNTYEFYQPVDSVFSIFHLDTPGAGSHTYTVEVQATSVVQVSERQMLVTELRR